jgi:hypothetical protein
MRVQRDSVVIYPETHVCAHADLDIAEVFLIADGTPVEPEVAADVLFESDAQKVADGDLLDE